MVGQDEPRPALEGCRSAASVCTRCPGLVASRTQVVFGVGGDRAPLMFVGDAPGRDEDLLGVPLAGRPGDLLSQLLDENAIPRDDVFVTTVLKCRPPDNRDPAPSELERCADHLLRQIEVIRPRVICPLGNIATKLLRGEPSGITRLHGRVEVRVVGVRAIRLFPLFHPAAALYQRASVDVLRADFAHLPALLALPEPDQPQPPSDIHLAAPTTEATPPAQLELF